VDGPYVEYSSIYKQKSSIVKRMNAQSKARRIALSDTARAVCVICAEIHDDLCKPDRANAVMLHYQKTCFGGDYEWHTYVQKF